MARAKNMISVARNVGLALGLTLGLAACSTVQENPYYQYSTKYQGASDTSYASNGAVTTPATYTQASSQSYSGQSYSGFSTSAAAEAECRNKESNREILGGAAGGALGAFAGKKIIGGTGGTIAGAVVGGAAGYGLGDISVDCSPQQAYQPAATQQYQPAATQTYQPAPVQAAPATYSSAAPSVVSPSIVSPGVVASTDTLYSDTQVVNGTPGYAVYQGEGLQTVEETAQIQRSAAQASNSYVSNPHSGNVHTGIQSSGIQANGATQITDYDYSANLITADTAVNSQGFPASETRILGGHQGFQSYVVQPGDTVYGLSRKLCASVAEIQNQNNINASYGINIGQTISLPQSRC